MFVRYKGQWLHVRHKERETWECPGGHIEQGETPLECARRELREEAGVVACQIEEAFDYWAEDNLGNSSGRVFLVQAHELADIPEDFEMAERALTRDPPLHLTYPLIYNTLFPRILWITQMKEGMTQ